MRVVGVLVIALALAGCMTTTRFVAPECALQYPDGSPKDCLRDEAVGLTTDDTNPGVGWTCVHDLDSDRSGTAVRYELWRSDAGEWQAAIFGHGSAKADQIVTTVSLHGERGPIVQRIVATTSDGFVALGSATDVTRWTVWTYAFAATGAEIEVRATAWNDTTWFVYGAADKSWAQDGMAVPDGAENYYPVPVTVTVGGQDVTVEQRNLIGQTGAVTELAKPPGLGLACQPLPTTTAAIALAKSSNR